MANRIFKFSDLFESYLNHLLRDCNINPEDLKNTDTITNLGKMLELVVKELYTPSEIFKNRINYTQAVKDSLQNRFFYIPPKYSSDELDNIDKTLKIIDNHPKHNQRSPEWYQFRWERLTASDLHKAIGEKGEKSKLELVYQKSIPLDQYIKQRESTSLTGAAIQHGICFEPVANELYEVKNNVSVIEYGCLPHIYIDYLAASPDGICKSRDSNPNYHGRMLEIKCPYSRVITGIPKTEYYMQVQLQLEVCDLEYCDFLECDIRIYSSLREFLNDSPGTEPSYKFTKAGKYKGIIYEYYENGNKSPKYKYCSIKLPEEEILTWIENTKKEILSNSRYHSGGCKYWWIEEYNETLLKRESEYFSNMEKKLREFWKLVLYYRKNGIADLERKINFSSSKKSNLSLDGFLEINDSQDMNYVEMPDLDNIDFIDFIDFDNVETKSETKSEPKNESKIENKTKKSLLVIRPDEDED